MDFQLRLQQALLSFVPFLMAVIIHEFGHGFMAKKWGDNTAEAAGRLTLNPIPHVDPLGTVFFPLLNMITGIPIMFGWAKPVPINPNRFRKYRPGLFWVAVAGPGANVLLALLSAIVTFALIRFLPEGFYLRDPFVKMAGISVQLNFALAVFNLLPLPPLDGSKILQVFMSHQNAEKLEELSAYSLWILLAAMWLGVLNLLSGPIQFLTEFTFGLAGLLFGVATL